MVLCVEVRNVGLGLRHQFQLTLMLVTKRTLFKVRNTDDDDDDDEEKSKPN